ncbi:MAG: ABC transporter substrate-binding protein [Clostridia bacterium]|nr:ABC transporter substrate-binding protein [Clostridia bacterium]
MKAKKILVVALIVVMCLTTVLAGCGKKEAANDTLVVGYSYFNSKFSPFFSETAYDQDVMAMTQISLLNADRQGQVVLKGIEGETRSYNGTDYTYYGPADCTVTENADGTVTYDFKLREDLVFSDGEKLTADDVIFSMYVFADPAFDGAATFFTLPIVGMEEYRSGMDLFYNLLMAKGKDNTDFSLWTEAEQNKYWNEAIPAAGEKFAQSIIDYVITNYGAAYGVSDAQGAAGLWGFEIPAGGTAKDFWDAIMVAYDGDVATASATEKASNEIYSFLDEEWKAGKAYAESAPKIAGIEKTGEYSVRVTLKEVSAVWYTQLPVIITPLHYYGSKDLYDYDNNKFGFVKGDMSLMKAKTTVPMGAGAYKFVSFENGLVRFEANDKYFLGAPKIKNIQFLESSDAEKLNGLITGTVDVTDPSISDEAVKTIKAANSNGELQGDKVVTSLVDNLGYGYIGMNATQMNIGGVKDSAASKNLRKAFATVFSVYRDLAIDSYYGERAAVINYPISNTSWAAPQAADPGYEVAFSKDVNGNPIYTSDMTAEQKYDAALKAALGYFEAAGFKVENGKVVAAPEGGTLTYTAWIPADGTGDHPSFMIFSEADKALDSIGIDFIVKDLTNSSELWDALDAQQVQIWAAAWGATVDPDMYQIYFSGDETNLPGGSNYEYAIDDKDLNKLILAGRKTSDTAVRKAIYKSALDIVIDWAVEVPVYQRQNCIIFNPQVVKMETVTPDITTFYGWMAEIEKTELK